MASTSEWLHFHQTNPSAAAPAPHTATAAASPTGLFWSSQLSEAAVVSTTMNSSTTNAAPGPTQQLAPDGRVSKPARRRTRASRRTPTTLLNTDTTNFRAMVQQFTGGPSTAFGFGTGTGPTAAQARWGPALPGPGSGFGLQFPYVHDRHTGGRSDLVQQGARGGGGGDMFGNINVGIFPGTGGGGSSSSENRSSSNNGSGGFQL